MSSNQYTVNIVNADELYIGGRKIQALELGVLVSDDASYGIGIGTDKPRLKLDISGADGIRIPVGTTGERPTYDTIKTNNTKNLLGILRYNTSTGKYEAVYENATLPVPSWGNFVIETGTNVGDNKVGINTGTATPRQTLDVNGKIGINDYIIHNGNTDTTIGFPTNDTLTITTGGTERMRVSPSGNVGIGTDTPYYKLHVYEKENITKTMISFNKKAFLTSSNYIENTLVTIANDSFTWTTVPRYGFKLGSWKNDERSGFTLETINNSSSDWKNRLKINQNGFFYFNSPDTETETFYSPYHFSFKPRTTNKYSKINANSTSKINDLTFSNLSLLSSVSQNVFGKHSVFIGKGCSLYNVVDQPSTPEFIAFSEEGNNGMGSQNFYGGGIMLNDKIHFITYNKTNHPINSLKDSDENAIYDGAKFPLSTYTRMTIDETGNVGIGTTNAQGYKLYVNGTMKVTGNVTGNLVGNASTASTANTLVGGPTLNYTSPLFTGGWSGSDGLGNTNYWNHGGQYQLKLASSNSCMVFRVTRTWPYEAMIQVGHESPSYSQYKGNLFLNQWGGSVYTGSSVGVTSDDRVKHNEKPIKNALSIIKQLKPLNYIKTTKMYDRNHHFELDASGVPINEENRKLIFESEYIYETGLIAQKVREIPELEFCVRGVESEISKETIFKKDSSGNDILDEDGKKIIEKEIERVEERKLHMDYNSIFTMHIAATQEIDEIQQAEKTKLDEQTSKLDEQTSKLDEQTTKLEEQTSKLTAAEAEIATLKTTLTNVLARLAALELN